MEIKDIVGIYASTPQAKALVKSLEKKSAKTLFLQGLVASSAPVFFASLAKKLKRVVLFILQDADEAGYFYHDLTQILGDDNVLFYPSGYRRAVKYGQRDAASDILRTEVLSRLSRVSVSSGSLYIVTSPSAVAELVVSKKRLDSRTLSLKVGQTIDIVGIEKTLREFGFEETDYVYEPGQFAVRGSILDVYSFSSELPFRVDFFGDDIDTIRTFEVESQLSHDKLEQIDIVPELATLTEEKIPFLQFLPDSALLVMKDYIYVHDTIQRIYDDGFSSQAITEQLEGKTEVEQEDIKKELKRESQLITGSMFTDDAAKFSRIEFGSESSILQN